MSRRDRADGSAPPRSAPRERFGGRDRAEAPAAPRSAPRERTHRGPETAVEMTDGPAEQARDLDQLVAELRDLEAYNQRQERVLRRMQRSRERDGLRTQTDHTAGGSNADEFFNRRSSSGGGGARSVQDPHLPQSLRQRTRDGTRGGTSTRRPRRAATPPRHLRRESTDFVTSDDPDYDLTGDVESDENERLPPSGGRVHHVRVTEVDHDVDPFDSPLFTSGHPRRSTTGGRGRVQPSGGDYDQLVDEVGELARSVSHLTRYVERLGATPPRRSVSRGGVPRRHGQRGRREGHTQRRGRGPRTAQVQLDVRGRERDLETAERHPRARVGTRPDPLSRAVAIPARQRHRLGGQRPPARPRAWLRPLLSRESRRRLHKVRQAALAPPVRRGSLHLRPAGADA